MQLMHRETRLDPFPPLPTQSELQAFKATRIGGPSALEFRVDVSGKNRHSPWNARAGRVLADEYIELPGALTSDKKLVQKAFLAHVPALCVQYRKQDPTQDCDHELETDNVRRSRRNKVRTLVEQSFAT